MSDYHFLPQDTGLSKEEILLKYNELIEEVWLLQHRMQELSDNYDLLLQDYEEVSNKLFG